MSKVLSVIFIFCLCFIFVYCASSKTYKKSMELSANEKQLVKSGEKFGFKLFKEIIKQDKDKNVFISPLSISIALGMLYNGADGTTKEEMKKTLELSDLTIQDMNQSYKGLMNLLINTDPKVNFLIANSIWYHSGFPVKDEFINTNKTYFNAEVKGLNFRDSNAPNIINSWVDKNTNSKINKIVDKIDPLTVMYLINAIYFKGDWTYKFDEKETYDDQFNLLDGSKKPCKMMKIKHDFNYLENEYFKAIDLPYSDGNFSMVIFLPNDEIHIDSLIAKFNQENWNKWMGSFSKGELTLQMPKFTIEYEVNLNDALKLLGMKLAFDETNANFKNIYNKEKMSENLYVSKVKHKTFVKVNEEGTEAAAVTAVELSIKSAGLFIRVDRPFIFAIKENSSKSIIFLGKIVEPKL